MGRHKKYTPKQLRTAIDAYFASIGRTVTVTEEYPTGERDESGHAIMAQREVYADSGEPIRRYEYIIPPTAGGLCASLGISRETWSSYCDQRQHPELADITAAARERLLAYREEQLLTREGKNVKGIIFDLQNNYKWLDRSEVEIGQDTRTQLADAPSLAEKLELIRQAAATIKDIGE